MAPLMGPMPATSQDGMKTPFPPPFPLVEAVLLGKPQGADASPIALENNVVTTDAEASAANASPVLTAQTINALSTGVIPTAPEKCVGMMDVEDCAEPVR